jgi:hypothetical protein
VRPVSAYIQFSNDKRAEVREENPGERPCYNVQLVYMGHYCCSFASAAVSAHSGTLVTVQ